MNLDRRISLACAHMGISESALADKIGVSRAYISALKHGKSKGLDTLQHAARELGVDPHWLISGTGDAPEWAKRQSETIHHQQGENSIRIRVRPSPATSLGAIPRRNTSGIREISFPTHGEAVIFHDDGGLPIVAPGQAVVIDPNRRPTKGDLVVFWINGKPALSRYVEEQNGMIFLASLRSGVDSTIINIEEAKSFPFVVTAILLNNFTHE